MVIEMMRFKHFFANILAGSLDFAVGCFIVTTLATLLSHELAWWQVTLGGILALLPDLDLVPLVLFNRPLLNDHRQTLFHRPILLIPVAAGLAYALGGVFWLIASLIATTWHFVHDTDWSGQERYGIAWFWPFTSYFVAPTGFYTPPQPLPHETWLATNWLQPSAMSRFELITTTGLLLITAILYNIALLSIFLGFILLVWLAIAWLWFHV